MLLHGLTRFESEVLSNVMGESHPAYPSYQHEEDSCTRMSSSCLVIGRRVLKDTKTRLVRPKEDFIAVHLPST